mmetsp:Transcript_28937/g.67297  ORF Transcript_28937/g.67297 Transcript_28937/m.67297 type:complete len:263 (-) Transcript_28937:3550-4338(-)
MRRWELPRILRIGARSRQYHIEALPPLDLESEPALVLCGNARPERDHDRPRRARVVVVESSQRLRKVCVVPLLRNRRAGLPRDLGQRLRKHSRVRAVLVLRQAVARRLEGQAWTFLAAAVLGKREDVRLISRPRLRLVHLGRNNGHLRRLHRHVPDLPRRLHLGRIRNKDGDLCLAFGVHDPVFVLGWGAYDHRPHDLAHQLDSLKLPGRIIEVQDTFVGVLEADRPRLRRELQLWRHIHHLQGQVLLRRQRVDATLLLRTA